MSTELVSVIPSDEASTRLSSVVNPLDLPTEVFTSGLDRRKANRSALLSWIKSSLVEGVDYGKVQTKRGPSKPPLFKPGAEKICGMLGLTVHFPALSSYEDAALSGVALEHVILRCELQDARGRVVADGVGARKVAQDFGDLNKSLKMSCKSAQIDATLRMAGLSEVFTQDLEDQLTEDAASRKANGTSNSDVITPERLGLLQQRLQTLGLDEQRLTVYVRKVAVAKGLKPVNTLADLPAALFDYILKKLPELAQRTQTGSAAS